MDPDVAYNTLINLCGRVPTVHCDGSPSRRPYLEGRLGDALEAALALRGWFASGGFDPEGWPGGEGAFRRLCRVRRALTTLAEEAGIETE